MKNLYLIPLLTCITLSVFAQNDQDSSHLKATPSREKNNSPLKDRLFFGGDLGLNFGDVTYIYLAPTIGYKLTDKLGVGLGPSYSYLKDKRYNYETNTYGGRLFSQYRIFNQALLYGEYGLINAEVYDLLQTELVRATIPSLLLGGGYTAEIGNRSNFTIMALWNFAESNYVFYENPIIRAGFNVGF